MGSHYSVLALYVCVFVGLSCACALQFAVPTRRMKKPDTLNVVMTFEWHCRYVLGIFGRKPGGNTMHLAFWSVLLMNIHCCRLPMFMLGFGTENMYV